MSNKMLCRCLIFYVLVGLLTFGRAYNNAPPPKWPEFTTQQEKSFWHGIGAMIGWPLYWSAVAWEKP